MCSLGRFILLFIFLSSHANAQQPTSLKSWESKALIYIVSNGDNWVKLSKKFKISTTILKEYNNLKPEAKLLYDTKITIPAKIIYTVKDGETSIGVASKHGMSFSQLIALNNINEPFSLYRGQKLKVIQLKPIKKLKSSPHRSSFKLNWPVEGKVVESFGRQVNGKHTDGIKISIAKNSYIKSARKGKVVYVGNEIGSYGNLIIIQHGTLFSSYGHLDKIKIKKGDYIESGQIIGYINKKKSKISFLYFSLRDGNNPINPMRYLIQNHKRKS